MRQYETVIGLEVHVELNTQTKIFCGCQNTFGSSPNTQTCPVCAGMPGSLPVLNEQVVEYALKAGLALNCQINSFCRFDRKNYFYPDNPQNYQISQLYLPICHDGWLEITTGAGTKRIGIHEIHMEEDAGKLIHEEWQECSLVDYNRSGVPLIEIVSEPDMRNAQDVIAYLDKLRLTMQYLGVSDCKLQEGSMRADVNLSIREVGSSELGIRTEMKNLNSFKAIARAIEGEKARQIELLEEGKTIIQETRRWDDNKECSYTMRSKEDAKDYRYFPDPDLPPLWIEEEQIKRIKAEQPELRSEKLVRYQVEYQLSEYDAAIITESKALAAIFEETATISKQPKKAANWLIGETLKCLKEQNMEPEEIRFSPMHLARLITLIEEGKINQTIAKEVFAKIFSENIEPEAYIKEQGLGMVEDTDALKQAVAEVIATCEKAVTEYREGKTKVIAFLIGQVMKKMQGKANPEKVAEVLRAELEK